MRFAIPLLSTCDFSRVFLFVYFKALGISTEFLFLFIFTPDSCVGYGVRMLDIISATPYSVYSYLILHFCVLFFFLLFLLELS